MGMGWAEGISITNGSTGWILGWTLVHSLWQGALVAAGLALVLRFVPGSMARVRAGVSWAALVLVVGLAAVTWVLVDREWRAHAACWDSQEFARANATLCASHAVQAASDELEATVGEDWKSTIARPQSWVNRLALPVPSSLRSASRAATGRVAVLAVVGAGLAWFALLRLVIAVGLLRGILERSRPLSRPDLDRRLRRLAGQLNVEGQVRLRETDEVSTPAVAGWRKPVILVPRGMADLLTPEQVEDVLTHELVHIRGRHFAVNLGQRALDCLCVFNPFALWISGRIREEREVQCDHATAGAPSGRRRRYVETLLQLEDLRRPASPALLGLLGEGCLLRRIRRLADAPPPDRRSRGELRRGVLAASLGVATVLIVVQFSLTMVSLTSWSVMSHDIAERRTPGPETAPATVPDLRERTNDLLRNPAINR